MSWSHYFEVLCSDNKLEINFYSKQTKKENGHCDNRKLSSKYMIQIEIAKKLIKLSVNEDVASTGTELPIETIKEIKENSEDQ